MNAPWLPDLPGPNLDGAPPVEQQLSWLDQQLHDPEAYAQLWVAAVEVAGTVRVEISAAGETLLELGCVADEHDRIRLCRLDALSQHMRASGHRASIVRLLTLRHACIDHRPNDLRLTTETIRSVLAVGGRMMINPYGEFEVAISFAGRALTGERQPNHLASAMRDFWALRARYRSHRHMERAVRLAGKPRPNGWIVLEMAR